MEALEWADWLAFRAWADEVMPDERQSLMAQHPARRGVRRG